MSAVTTQPRGGLPGLRGRGRGAPRARGVRGRVRTASPLGRQVVNGQNAQAFAVQSPAAFVEMRADQASFDQLKKAREKERADAIARGQIDDPDKPKRLDQAITFVGTCQDMCPPFERVTRIVQNNVDSNEKQPTEISGTPVQQKFVKEFRRSAAGIEAPLPSDVRPPQILSKTLDYLMGDVLGGPRPLPRTHKFLWSRTRSVRQDFTFQNVNKVSDLLIAIECFERIARFHILSLHLMSDPLLGDEGFSHQQEREQLYKTLTSLMYFYEDCRQKNAKPPNESEFRAYYIVAHIRDQDIERQAQLWPADILDHPRVQTALELYSAIQNVHDFHGTLVAGQSEIGQNFYQRFWRIMQSNRVSYLLGCLAETHFNHVRKLALTAILAGFRTPQPVQDWTLPGLVESLGFDHEQEVNDFCVAYGLTIANDGYLVLSGNVEDPSPPLPQRLSLRVERKRKHRTMPAIVAGLTVRQATAQGLIKEERSLFVEERGRPTNSFTANSAMNGTSGFTANSTMNGTSGFTTNSAPNGFTGLSGFNTATPFQFGSLTQTAKPAAPFNPFASKPATPDPFVKAPEAAKPFNPFAQPVASPFQKPLAAQSFNPFQPKPDAPKPFSPFQAAESTPFSPFKPIIQPELPKPAPNIDNEAENTTLQPNTTSTTDKPPSLFNPFSKPVTPNDSISPLPKSPFVFGQPPALDKPDDEKPDEAKPTSPKPTAFFPTKPADTPLPQAMPGFTFPAPVTQDAEPPPAQPSLFDRISKPVEQAPPPPPAAPEDEPMPFVIEPSPEPETEPPSAEFAEWFLFGDGGMFDQLVEHNWNYFESRAKRQLEAITDAAKASNFRERVLMERYFYRWKERAYQSRLRRRGKRRRTQARSDTHWAPVQYRGSADALDEAAEARRAIFRPYNLGKIFSGEVSKSLADTGMSGTWGVLCYNSDEKVDYWWHTKFVGEPPVPVQQECDENTGCVIFGCSADYSLSPEVRFQQDAQRLHQVVHKAAAHTNYESIILLVLCYRSPLDHSDLGYSEVDVERLSQPGRMARRSAIMKALHFSDLPRNVIGREVALIEAKEDLDLRPQLRVVRGLILSTINPVLAKYRTKRDGQLVNGVHEDSPAPKRSRTSSYDRQRLSLPNFGSRRMPSTASIASSVSSVSSRRYNWSGDFATPGFTRASSSFSQRFSQSQRSQSESENWLRESRHLLQNLSVRRPIPKIELPDGRVRDSDEDEPRQTQKSQATVPDEDDELFAQARRVMSAMDEDVFTEMY